MRTDNPWNVRRYPYFVLTLVLVLIGPLSLAALPPVEVTLFTSGVGEVVHRGEVTGNGTISLAVPADQMSDILRSLTLVDLDGGTVEAVTYPTGDTIATRLGRHPIDLSSAARMYQVLHQVRGTTVEVTIQAPQDARHVLDDHDRENAGVEDTGAADTAGGSLSAVTGTLVGATENTLFLVRNEILREIPHWQIVDVRFLDPAVQQAFQAASDALATVALESNQRELTIRYSGSGTRTLEIRYLQEMPRWHTTFRVVVDPASDRALLQGWAHLDNTSAADWENAVVTLVAAQPVTYRYDLYRPQYVERPPYSPDSRRALHPASTPESMMLRSAPSAVLADEYQERRTGSIAPALEAETLTTGMTFTIPGHTTVLRGSSIMIPIVNESVPADIVRHFDPARGGERPSVAFRFTNESDRILPGGPVTVYEGKRYVGDGSIGMLLPGAEAVVTYALDSDLRVTTTTDSADEQIVSARIVDGLLVSEHRSRNTTTYHVRSSTNTFPDTAGKGTLLASHRVRAGWHVVTPTDAKVQGSIAEISLVGATTLVVEERVQSRRYALTGLDEQLLASFSSNRTIDATVRRTLRNVATLQQTVEERARARRILEERRDAIFRDQERISANMGGLDRDAPLYRRYASTLEQQEEELNRLQAELMTARDREERARSALREYLRALGAE